MNNVPKQNNEHCQFDTFAAWKEIKLTTKLVTAHLELAYKLGS